MFGFYIKNLKFFVKFLLINIYKKDRLLHRSYKYYVYVLRINRPRNYALV